MTYAEAAAQFKAGLTEAEIRKIFGEPQSAVGLTDTMLWRYYQEKKIRDSRTGEFEGFTIDFKNGRSVTISRTLTTLR